MATDDNRSLQAVLDQRMTLSDGELFDHYTRRKQLAMQARCDGVQDAAAHSVQCHALITLASELYVRSLASPTQRPNRLEFEWAIRFECPEQAPSQTMADDFWEQTLLEWADEPMLGS